jgi:hypothetical protein
MRWRSDDQQEWAPGWGRRQRHDNEQRDNDQRDQRHRDQRHRDHEDRS